MGRLPPTTAGRQADLFADLAANDDAAPRPLPEPSNRRPRGVTVPALPSDDEMAEHLVATGRYRVLRRLMPRPMASMPSPWPIDLKRGVILDTETTGLDHSTHEVIEIGMVAFTYDDAGIRDVIDVFSALREPSQPITAEITRITGITDEMVRGQTIDLDAVERFIEPADLVVAHNARFDRPFCEKLARGFDVKPWACSVSEIDWTSLGFEGTKLGYLVGQAGYFHTGHRAVDDCHALLEVLSGSSPNVDVPAPFFQLVASAGRDRLRIHAIGSPFHTKDILKARGYRWADGSDGRPKCWWREVDETAFGEEDAFLTHEIYGGYPEAIVHRLTACERFKS
ncbi:3'-5' exonuclease [Aureimonas sp. Leaf324]|uniref:3'-5' exonuclease n=1 Tax=Aureimonas sp. Leaf324 TaxID=1736336 RepID=UPI0006FD84A7|nr:3'-5' exonuclease [Aureimonas sp. Leaf324]KQQ86257.1 DNA polymerase III subunit epsilon [Aureimonas sp. Leaf324]